MDVRTVQVEEHRNSSSLGGFEGLGTVPAMTPPALGAPLSRSRGEGVGGTIPRVGSSTPALAIHPKEGATFLWAPGWEDSGQAACQSLI